MTHPTPVPSRPGIYEDAAGALISVHFEDGSPARLMAAPLVEARGVPMETTTVSARGPYTVLVPLTETDRRRIVAALRTCARLGGVRGAYGAETAEALTALAGRVEAVS